MNVSQYNHNYNIHNQHSFKALKGVHYNYEFNPSKRLDDAKVVKAFLDSTTFKMFTDMFDTVVNFSKINFEGMNNSWVSLEYREIKQKEKNIFKRITSLFVEKCEPHKIVLSSYGYNSCENLRNKIKQTRIEDLMAQHKYNLKNQAKERQETLEIGAINKEITDSFNNRAK